MIVRRSTYRSGRAYALVLPVVLVWALATMAVWPPEWVIAITGAIAFLLGPGLIAPIWDEWELRLGRRRRIELSVLQRRSMFGSRPLNRKERLRLNRLLGQRWVIAHGVGFAGDMSAREATDVHQGLHLLFDPEGSAA